MSEATKPQLKVLEAIYSITDCSNEVLDYACLRWRQAKIAEEMPLMVEFTDDCERVDGDGFRYDSPIGSRGYRLTNAGYEALTRQWPETYPTDLRRFWTSDVAAKGGDRGEGK
jgi:hypothetical protein